MKQFLFTIALGLGYWAPAIAQSEPPLTREGGYWVRTIQGAVDASPAGQLRVETTGNVVLHGTSGEQTTYTLKVRVKASNAREAEARLQRFNVKTGTEGGWAYLKATPPRLVSSSVELTVTGPRSLRQVLAETRGGNVEASDWDGEFEARSGGGQIDEDRIRGRSELRTAGGNIHVGTVTGPVRCFSGGGDVRVESARSEVFLETAGGEIFVHQADGPVQATTGGGNIRIERAGSTVVARTAGGLIQVQQADGPVTAESAGGAIQVNSANGVRCESAGGAIRLRNVAGPVRAVANSGSIFAELTGDLQAKGQGIADSVLSTNGGDITVLIASNVALTVKAMNESGGMGRITSDFPQVHTQSVGPSGGPAMADGALNGGGPVLRLSVVNGSIYIRRMK